MSSMRMSFITSSIFVPISKIVSISSACKTFKSPLSCAYLSTPLISTVCAVLSQFADDVMNTPLVNQNVSIPFVSPKNSLNLRLNQKKLFSSKVYLSSTFIKVKEQDLRQPCSLLETMLPALLESISCSMQPIQFSKWSNSSNFIRLLLTGFSTKS